MVMSGPLRDKVLVQTPNVTKDATGGNIKTFVTLCTRRAQIIPLSGDEKEFGNAMESRATHMVRIRHFEDLDTKQRFLFGTREFNIVRIIDKNNRHRLDEVLVKEDI